jgi:DNA-binding Xre family transcriptional regulator
MNNTIPHYANFGGTMIKIMLEELCKERGIKLLKVNQDTGIEYTTLHRYKTNATTGIQLRHIDTLCKYFKISPNELLRVTHIHKAKNKIRK